MSAFERVRNDVRSGAFRQMPPTAANGRNLTESANTIAAPVLKAKNDKDSDSDSDDDIWEPSESSEATINSMTYFAPEHWSELKKKEQKESYKNIMLYLDVQFSSLIAQAEKEADSLFE